MYIYDKSCRSWNCLMDLSANQISITLHVIIGRRNHTKKLELNKAVRIFNTCVLLIPIKLECKKVLIPCCVFSKKPNIFGRNYMKIQKVGMTVIFENGYWNSINQPPRSKNRTKSRAKTWTPVYPSTNIQFIAHAHKIYSLQDIAIKYELVLFIPSVQAYVCP